MCACTFFSSTGENNRTNKAVILPKSLGAWAFHLLILTKGNGQWVKHIRRKVFLQLQRASRRGRQLNDTQDCLDTQGSPVLPIHSSIERWYLVNSWLSLPNHPIFSPSTRWWKWMENSGRVSVRNCNTFPMLMMCSTSSPRGLRMRRVLTGVCSTSDRL